MLYIFYFIRILFAKNSIKFISINLTFKGFSLRKLSIISTGRKHMENHRTRTDR